MNKNNWLLNLIAKIQGWFLHIGSIRIGNNYKTELTIVTASIEELAQFQNANLNELKTIIKARMGKKNKRFDKFLDREVRK